MRACLISIIKIWRCDKAVELVELALVLPFLIVVFAAGIEFSRSMNTYSRLNMLVREVTRAGFSECAQIASPNYKPAMNLAVRTCFATAVNDTNLVLGQILPGVRIVLSMYKWDTTYVETALPLHVPPYRDARPIAEYSPNGMSSRIAESSFHPGRPPEISPRSARSILLENHRVLVYGEVEYVYRPIVPFISKLFGFGNDKTFYVATSF